jgi:hypothetical protein
MFMPSELYSVSSPTALAAAFAAKQEQQSSASNIMTGSTAMSPIAFSAAEKKIELYSGVR